MYQGLTIIQTTRAKVKMTIDFNNLGKFECNILGIIYIYYHNRHYADFCKDSYRKDDHT
jgi:hypothetical protein